MAAVLADAHAVVLELRLRPAFGFLPHEVRHAEGGYGGQGAGGVVHVAAEPDAAVV